MNRPPEEQRSCRPRDFALLWLAGEQGPPRSRARDQQADLAGARLVREVLDRLVAADPEPEDWEPCLSRIIDEIDGPEGPTRSVAILLSDQWRAACFIPGFWEFLLGQAVNRDEPRALADPRERSGN